MPPFLDDSVKLHDVVKFKPSDWRIAGEKTITRIIRDAENGLGQDGKKFRPYSPEYAELKKAGKAAPEGVSGDRQVNPPNLRLTGQMFSSMQTGRATKTGVEIKIGQGEKAEKNAKRGRNIIGISDKNLGSVANDLAHVIGEKADSWAKKSLTFGTHKRG